MALNPELPNLFFYLFGSALLKSIDVKEGWSLSKS